MEVVKFQYFLLQFSNPKILGFASMLSEQDKLFGRKSHKLQKKIEKENVFVGSFHQNSQKIFSLFFQNFFLRNSKTKTERRRKRIFFLTFF